MFEFIVFHTTPSALSLAGAAIIISSAIYVSLAKKTAVESATGPPRAATAHPSRKPQRSAALIAWCNDVSSISGRAFTLSDIRNNFIS
ncbi:hypothetical protein BGY98DRAFT_99726 [Russula aff. rugulosa BPL654]|nr:hypothetical protein BGY98DRAFT_99726 [Russula aff. rugulosa BPL654]